MDHKRIHTTVLRVLIFFWVTWGIGFSCRQTDRPERSALPEPTRVIANGHVLPDDSIQLPVQVPLRNLDVVKVGTPKIVPIASKQHFFTSPKKHDVGAPAVCIIGQNGYEWPRYVAAGRRMGAVGMPEKILAKNPVSKDYDPNNISSFGLIHGLKNLNISEVVQDKFGNLWIATGYGGVSKYDGKSFTNYTENEGLLNNTVLNILIDKDDNLWFATFGGATKYDGKTFTHYTTKEGLIHNLVFEIIEDRQRNLWFATYGGVSRLDPQHKTFTNFTTKQGLPYNLVHKIYEDKRGDIWVGMYNHGISNIQVSQRNGRESVQFTNYTQKQGLVGDNMIAILEDSEHNLWFGCDAGLSKCTQNRAGQLASVQNFTNANGLCNNVVNFLIEDYTGNILIATENGLTTYEPPSGNRREAFRYLTERDGLPDKSAISLFEDNLQNIWIGTQNGFCKYSSNPFSFLTEEDGLSDKTILAIKEDRKGNIWLGTGGHGITKYEPPLSGRTGSFTHYTTREGLSDDYVCDIHEDRQGNLWFATKNGLTKYVSSSNGQADTFTRYTHQQGLPSNFIMSIMEDRAGNLWFSMLDDKRGGVSKFDGRTFTNFGIKQGLPKEEIVSIAQDKQGSFWFATWGNGIAKYDPAPGNQKGKFAHFTTQTGLSNDKVRPITVDSKGTVWMGTLGGGLNCYVAPSAGSPATFTRYTERNGLSNNNVYSILEDSHGNLWFGNYYGISRFSPDKGTFINYTQENGYSGIGSKSNAICEDRYGKIWLGSVDQLTIFDPANVRPDTTLPSIQLTDVNLFNEKTIWKKDTTYALRNGIRVGNFQFSNLSAWCAIPEQLILPYNNNFITFDFVGINTNMPQLIRYQYQLEGLEDSWSAPTSRSEAVYGNLSPGNYVFKIKARNGEGKWGNVLSYSFMIRPPWWTTWWAYLLYGLLIASSIYAWIQYRVRQSIEKIKAQEAIRIKISSDLHDDVGSILSGLAMQSQMIALTAREEQKEPLGEISAMSHDAMERMRDTVWAIDSRKDKYENLIDRMRAFAERTLAKKGITHEFDILIDDPKKFIDPQKRQNIYLLFREAITNICKHSDATHVRLKFWQTNRQLCLLIHDNGTYKKIVNSDGLGLPNMQMRASQLGGTLQILYNSGFNVELTVG